MAENEQNQLNAPVLTDMLPGVPVLTDMLDIPELNAMANAMAVNLDAAAIEFNDAELQRSMGAISDGAYAQAVDKFISAYTENKPGAGVLNPEIKDFVDKQFEDATAAKRALEEGQVTVSIDSSPSNRFMPPSPK